jgi:FtsH-binding integral membrane protein
MQPLDLLFQIAGLLLFLVCIGLGYWSWVVRYAAALDNQQRGVLLLLIVTLAGGFIGSPVWWVDDPRSFAWHLPPLAGRMLGAAGWSFVTLCLAIVERPTPARIRQALVMLGVYLAPLTVAILLWHLDRFDLNAPVTYTFFAIVTALLVPTLWFLIRPPQPFPATLAIRARPHSSCRSG